ncbi:MAG: aminotransferase class IV [Acidimicrobiales bacterium]
MSETIWRNGQLIPSVEATIHVLSHAAHRGSEVFDVLRVLPGDGGPVAVGLRAHVARFDRSMELMSMASPYDVATLERAVAETVAANPGATTVKLVAAWSEIAPTSRPLSLVPSIYVAALVDRTDPISPREPIDVVTSDMPKIPAAVLPPGLKVAASYTPGLRQQLAADRAGHDEVIFGTMEGTLAEATTQSLLVVRHGRVLAPSLDHVLDGITRRMLVDLITSDGVVVDVRDVGWDDVAAADELILTSSNRFLTPVGRLDGRVLDAPGPVSERLAALVADLAAGTHPLSGRWLTPLASLLA